ncbi:hypothetical protein ACFQO8_09640 [Exiguobacterium aestuarii]|uniref:Uncharacterized protein n=1 Tax=Exiguobacterium aestuarii TaxID=273527 RepID=A0ABW2PPE3_9BACL|nr:MULTISPECIES: hypothetical protein [Exiguobacterium]MCT4784752.1 hypothetical protein [Exiguobacterium aestuarii]
MNLFIQAGEHINEKNHLKRTLDQAAQVKPELGVDLGPVDPVRGRL